MAARRDSLEEDWFHLLVNPAHHALSLAAARVLAGQLLEAVEHRHAVAVARVGHSRASPLDLHALVPRVSAKSDGRNDRRPASAQCPQYAEHAGEDRQQRHHGQNAGWPPTQVQHDADDEGLQTCPKRAIAIAHPTPVDLIAVG